MSLRELPSRTYCRRIGRRRAVVLVLVLGMVVVATVLALTFVEAQGTTIDLSRNIVEHAKARGVAESGVRAAIASIESDTNWRTNRANGTWIAAPGTAMGDGTFTLTGIDGVDGDGDGTISVPAEGDGSLSDDTADPVTLTAIGRVGGATYQARAVVTPNGQTGFEVGSITVGTTAQTVTLTNTYTSPVVVCTARYSVNTWTFVPRVSNVTSSSFDVRLQEPGGASLSDETVCYLVMEEGAWTFGGLKCEAKRYTSTLTDRSSSWTGQLQSYQQTYTSPVVLGQVMTANDADWSVFWCRGTSVSSPPSATTLYAGKTVCEDTDTTRANETVGYVVLEAGVYTIDGVQLVTNLGTDIVRGISNSPPYSYTFASAFSAAPQIAIASQAAMDGPNGGWATLYGASYATTTQLRLAIMEDRIRDAESNHTTEQVGYLAVQSPMVHTEFGSGGASGGYTVRWQ